MSQFAGASEIVVLASEEHDPSVKQTPIRDLKVEAGSEDLLDTPAMLAHEGFPEFALDSSLRFPKGSKPAPDPQVFAGHAETADSRSRTVVLDVQSGCTGHVFIVQSACSGQVFKTTVASPDRFMDRPRSGEA